MPYGTFSTTLVWHKSAVLMQHQVRVMLLISLKKTQQEYWQCKGSWASHQILICLDAMEMAFLLLFESSLGFK